MNTPRLRYLVQPTMSVADRNLMMTKEVRKTMTTSTFPARATRQRGLELLVSRVAVGMLHWSQQRTARQTMTHEEMTLLLRVERERATAIDMARLNHLG
jgi:hypothetical protein